MCFKLFSIIFKECFLSGLDQETAIGELVSCVFSETRSKKETGYTCEDARRAQITVKLNGYRRII